MRGRFGELLLLLPPLQNTARLMVDMVTRYNQDAKHADDLINEMLLSRYFSNVEYKEKKWIIRSMNRKK